MGKEIYFKHAEGKILAFGLLLLAIFLLLLTVSAYFWPDRFNVLLSMTASNIIFGRMAGLSIGISSQMDTTLLIAFNLFIESIMVLILYPLFVLSWRSLHVVSYNPLNDFLKRSQKSAEKYQPMIKKYGIIGLLFFVLTPFAMTGPVVGSFVGYLMGLPHLTTLLSVLFSTLIAIILWTYFIKNFEATLIVYSDALIMVLSTAAVIVLIWYFMRKKRG
ncbi:small multi-drug export protein [Sulfurovum mangrovi]|uniref:small multi-drug export protein n=1 Tax=Sulfurovum mangrovi TaxID=2893889 RepID=UPI001E2E52B4|nr:small multi-drug export protein [Sulfurovum mangrovi]UFH59026.1 small multi-drug export protein [Sulfurovum mangrovi]